MAMHIVRADGAVIGTLSDSYTVVSDADVAALMFRAGHVHRTIGSLTNAAWLHLINGRPVYAGWDAMPVRRNV